MKKRLIAVLFILVLLLACLTTGVFGDPTEQPETDAPVEDPPAAEDSPASEVSPAEPPETAPAVLEEPAAQETEPAVIPEPETEPAVIPEPETEPPVIPEPETEPPVIPEPETEPPVIPEPETEPPVIPEPETEPEITEPGKEPDVIPEPETEPAVITEPETEPAVITEPETEPEIPEETEPAAEPEPDSPEPVPMSLTIYRPSGTEAQSFLYTITAPDGSFIQAVIPAGKYHVVISITVEGVYRVSEDSSWSWRVGSEESEKTVAVNADSPDPILTFGGQRSADRSQTQSWLNGESMIVQIVNGG